MCYPQTSHSLTLYRFVFFLDSVSISPDFCEIDYFNAECSENQNNWAMSWQLISIMLYTKWLFHWNWFVRKKIPARLSSKQCVFSTADDNRLNFSAMPLCFPEKIRASVSQAGKKLFIAIMCVYISHSRRWKMLSQGLKMRKCDSATKKQHEYIVDWWKSAHTYTDRYPCTTKHVRKYTATTSILDVWTGWETCIKASAFVK